MQKQSFMILSFIFVVAEFIRWFNVGVSLLNAISSLVFILNFIAPQIRVIVRSFQVCNVWTLLWILILWMLSTFSFSAIAFALTSLFHSLVGFECVLKSDLVPLHRINVGCPYSLMLLLLELDFVFLISVIFWYCAGLSLIVYFFCIVFLAFIFHLCGFKIGLWVLIFFICFSTFIPVIFIENVDLTVFNLTPYFMKLWCLTYCVSFLLIITLKAEITVQPIDVFLFWILIILLLNLIIIICKTLRSVCCLNKINLIWIFHLLGHYRSFTCFDHSFVALIYFSYIFQ